MTAAAALPDVTVAGETVRVVGRRQALVRSNSNPDHWHTVDQNDDGEFRCSCKGYECRRRCRHVSAVVAWTRGWERATVVDG